MRWWKKVDFIVIRTKTQAKLISLHNSNKDRFLLHMRPWLYVWNNIPSEAFIRKDVIYFRLCFYLSKNGNFIYFFFLFCQSECNSIKRKKITQANNFNSNTVEQYCYTDHLRSILLILSELSPSIWNLS